MEFWEDLTLLLFLFLHKPTQRYRTALHKFERRLSFQRALQENGTQLFRNHYASPNDVERTVGHYRYLLTTVFGTRKAFLDSRRCLELPGGQQMVQ